MFINDKETILDKNGLLNFLNTQMICKNDEKKNFGEVFTPLDFIEDKMLYDLEKYYTEKFKKNIWSNKNLTFYDPACGIGNFLIIIFYKLYDGLKNTIKNPEERKNHIIDNMLYGCEINKNNWIVLTKIFKSHKNFFNCDALKKDCKFDIIIGNPPYNEKFLSSGYAKPLYDKFIEYYIDKCKYMSFVIPSRWFAGGKNLDQIRTFFLNRKDIVYINHINKNTIFKNVLIEGGINYFLIDREYSGYCLFNNQKIENLNRYDILLEPKYYSIVDKVLKIKNKSLNEICKGNYYKIETNDKRLLNEKTETAILCYVSQNKGFTKYIEKNYIKKNLLQNCIITAEANGNKKSFGNMFIPNKNSVYTSSYICFVVNNDFECISLLSYLKCKLSNFLLGLRKTSQHINKTTCKWIILPNLTEIWTDEKVYKYFELSPDEIKIVENGF